MPHPPPPAGVQFERPPLTEVAFSVQFERDVIDEVRALSEFWPSVKDDFPGIQKHPPIAPSSEDFGPPSEFAPALELLSAPPSHRYWFLSMDEHRLIQVQPDRLLFNWRRLDGSTPYPRYATLAQEFSRHLRTFLAVVDEAGHTDAQAAWCELTYINSVPAGEPGGAHGQLARILNCFVRDPVREVMPPVEDTQLQQRFRLVGPGGVPFGRLYLTAVPGYQKADLVPVYMITLVGRGRPFGGDDRVASIFEFLNEAHQLIVRGFRELTTRELHLEWGLVED